MRGAGFLPGADLSMPTSTRASSASEQSHASRKLLKGLAPPPLFEPERTAEASASEHSPATAVLSRTGFVRGRRPDGPAALRIFPGRFALRDRAKFAPAHSPESYQVLEYSIPGETTARARFHHRSPRVLRSRAPRPKTLATHVRVRVIPDAGSGF
jgi:hypothetical protein